MVSFLVLIIYRALTVDIGQAALPMYLGGGQFYWADCSSLGLARLCAELLRIWSELNACGFQNDN